MVSVVNSYLATMHVVMYK